MFFTKEVMPMLDLQNDKNLILNDKINNELNTINHVTIIDDTMTENMIENHKILEETSSLDSSVLNYDIQQTNSTNTIFNTNNTDIPEPNCLALTIKKDYNLIIVKNIFTASGRISWKIVLSTIVLNILNMLF